LAQRLRSQASPAAAAATFIGPAPGPVSTATAMAQPPPQPGPLLQGGDRWARLPGAYDREQSQPTIPPSVLVRAGTGAATPVHRRDCSGSRLHSHAARPMCTRCVSRGRRGRERGGGGLKGQDGGRINAMRPSSSSRRGQRRRGAIERACGATERRKVVRQQAHLELCASAPCSQGSAATASWLGLCRQARVAAERAMCPAPPRTHAPQSPAP